MALMWSSSAVSALCVVGRVLCVLGRNIRPSSVVVHRSDRSRLWAIVEGWPSLGAIGPSSAPIARLTLGMVKRLNDRLSSGSSAPIVADV